MPGYNRTPDDEAFALGGILKFLGLAGDYGFSLADNMSQRAQIDLASQGLEKQTQDSLEQLSTQHYQRENDTAGVLGAQGLSGGSIGARGDVRQANTEYMAEGINKQAELQRKGLELRQEALDRQGAQDAIGLVLSGAGLGLDIYNDARENNWFGLAGKNKPQGYAYRQGLR